MIDIAMTRRAGTRRVALPRSAVVPTMIDLSAAALEDGARAALRRLAIFAGPIARASSLNVLGALEAADGASMQNGEPDRREPRDEAEAQGTQATHAAREPQARAPYAERDEPETRAAYELEESPYEKPPRVRDAIARASQKPSRMHALLRSRMRGSCNGSTATARRALC